MAREIRAVGLDDSQLSTWVKGLTDSALAHELRLIPGLRVTLREVKLLNEAARRIEAKSD